MKGQCETLYMWEKSQKLGKEKELYNKKYCFRGQNCHINYATMLLCLNYLSLCI